MSNKKPTALGEPPRELILEAKKNHTECRVDIRRRASKGQWNQCEHWMLDVGELLTIEDRLRQWGGGGDYRVHATDPATGNDVVPAFMVNLEGASKPFRDPSAAPEVPFGTSYTPQAVIDGIRNRYAATRRLEPLSFAPPREGRDEGAKQKYASDELAVREIDRLCAELDRKESSYEALRKELDESKRKHLETVESLRDELRQMRDSVKDREIEARQRELEVRLETASKNRLDLVGLMAAAAPILTAVMQNGASTRTAAAEAQARSQEQTMTLLTSMATAKDGTMSELVKLAPVLMPMVQQMMEARGPKAQAEIMQMMADQILTQTSMTAQVMQMAAENQPQDSPLAMLFQQVGGALERSAEVLARSAASEQQQERPQQPVHVHANAPPAQVQAGAQTEPIEAVQERELVDPDVAALPVWTRVSRSFHTAEWANLVHFMERGSTIEPLAVAICGQLENLDRIGITPPELRGVFEEPELLKTALLDHLDIAQSQPAYVDKLYEAIARELGAGDEDGDKENPEESEQEPRAAVVEAAPEAAAKA